ncbi:major facilitator superfamily domain-containing protein [Aspergillus avenaceus]|uniref:Major facilitator superfamily domain-containing protein n=1 Tax=Aspergillus avenaceus TaxID=36643 RepID=A0A5N6TNL9_ASPAV|nr:major facilitator superfamily domain-containing protein [Aspergillus avenaceus]
MGSNQLTILSPHPIDEVESNSRTDSPGANVRQNRSPPKGIVPSTGAHFGHNTFNGNNNDRRIENLISNSNREPDSSLPQSPLSSRSSHSRDIFDDRDDDNDSGDDAVESSREKPVTWRSLPKKGQLAILTLARLSEPLAQTSLQAYLFYQLKSFNPSLPDSTISSQAGILQGSFTAAQFVTAVWWGRLADAEWMGRKKVLMIGLLGTCISTLGFGFSRSFSTAVVFRTLGGILNSNVGVMRTMIAEIIQEKKYQSRAFLLLPMCFNIGVIIGPVLGGMLADPVKSYPLLFGPGSVFGGKGGVEWMQYWPFALPNLLSALFILISLIAVFLGLDETHEIAQRENDWGRNLGKRIGKFFHRQRNPYQYRPLLNYEDDESLYDENTTGRSVPSSPTRSGTRTRTQPPNFRQIWTPNIVLTLLVHFLLAFHTSACNSMTFVFLPAPRAPEGSREGFFHFGGGLGLPSYRVGLATAIIGFIGLPLQILVYPRVQARLGTLTSFRTFLPFSALAYALMPFIVLIPRYPWLVWPAFTIVVGFQVISRTFSLPAAIILVNNSVTDPRVLGTVHGVAQSISSGARTLGPFIGGWGLGLGFKYNLIGGIWWALALEALVGWSLLWKIHEDRGIEKNNTQEEDENTR